MRHHPWSRAILSCLAVVVVNVVPVIARAAPASGATAAPTCAPSALRLRFVSNIRSQGWLADTLFLGWVRFTNTGATCSLPVSRIVVRAEVGTTVHHTPAGTSESVSLLRAVTVHHGGFTSIYVMVTGTPPKGWKPGYCPTSTIVGLLVTGHSPSWPHRFVEFTTPRSVCTTFHISA